MRTRLHGKRLAALLGCTLLILTGLMPSAGAQSWPTKPLTLIVPFAPGGTTDIVSRQIAQKLGEALGQTLVIDNRGGGGGTLGAGIAARATPDGYTLFMSTVAHTMATSLYKSLPYDFERDFAPVTVVAAVPNILIVNPSLPVHSVRELITYAKAHPGALNYGSAGNGSTEHLSAELFNSLAGTKITHIPYKGGSPMMTDLVAGQVQVAIETSGSAVPQIRAGKVRALAVTTAERAPVLPDLPTLAEAGLPGYEVTTWYGLVVPAHTPEPVIKRIYSATASVLKQPDLQERLKDFGAQPGGMPPAAFGALIHAETVRWAKIVRESGATVD
jgi:tripartite-type tricarboxylate transporter receptor subunit TctC